jgi:hypothetical protein
MDTSCDKALEDELLLENSQLWHVACELMAEIERLHTTSGGTVLLPDGWRQPQG